jgi:hypothetical protein
MRRVLITGLLAVVTTTSSAGCFLNMYSADPIRRYRQLFYQSENLRLLEDDMERFWMIDQPSQLSLKRYHGLGEPAADTMRWLPSSAKEQLRDQSIRMAR